MTSLRSRIVVLGALLAATVFTTACRRTFVVVPRPQGGYTRVDTLRGYSDGREVRVIFRFDTTFRVDTVTRLDTLWRGGTRTLVRVDTVVRRDTIRIVRPQPSRDSVAIFSPTTVTDRERPLPPPPPRVDTVRITVRDTVFRVDTVRIAGRRMLFVPPGHYPPEGQCRVWIHDLPPGQQARAASCSALGEIPRGAFILFGDEAWDADYDWISESGRVRVPTEILTLSRRRRAP